MQRRDCINRFLSRRDCTNRFFIRRDCLNGSSSRRSYTTNPNSEINSFTSQIDKTLIADDRDPNYIAPQELGWCPDGYYMSCCWIDLPRSDTPACSRYYDTLTCNGRIIAIMQWLCCKLLPDSGHPNPKKCVLPGKGRRPWLPPVNIPERPTDLPGRPKPKLQEEPSVCPPRRTHEGLD